MKVLVTGGGTGGHVTPILAVLQHLRDKVSEIDICYVLDEKDNQQLINHEDLRVRKIKSGKFRRYRGKSILSQITDLKLVSLNLRDIFKVMFGIFQSINLILNEKPNVIFIKGGYVGVPVGIAATLLRVPFVIHDSDSVPGLANKILAPFAQKIAVGFPVQYYDYPNNKTVFTGNPVRKEFVQKFDINKIKSNFNIQNNNPTILVFGGSSGARKINKALLSVIEELLKVANIVHINGPEGLEEAKNTSEKLNDRNLNVYSVHEFINDIYKAMYISDIVVSRAGASSIAEIAAMEKPAILIPHPHLTGGHQIKNANILSKENAAIILSQEKTTNEPECIVSSIEALLNDSSVYTKNISKFFEADSANKIADLLVEHSNE